MRGEAGRFAEHLRAHAGECFPDLRGESVRVQLLRIEPRSASTHYRFAVWGAAGRHRVLIKVASPVPATTVNAGDSSALDTIPDPSAAAALEFRTLSGIQEHFSGFDPVRFGTVRAIQSLPEHRATIMEVVELPSLHALFARSCVARSATMADLLEEVFGNAGGWLRHYHAAPRPPGAPDRRVQRADFTGFIERLTGSLGEYHGDSGFFAEAAAAATSLVARSLPDLLPLGPAHGDFAMRNLLVGPGARVTVIDTRGAWYVPVYEDIGCFLHNLRHNRFQVLTRGAAVPRERLARYERAFLRGYFGDEPIPYPAVRLYEVQATLQKWSSLAAYRERARRWPSRLVRSARLELMSSLFRDHLSELLLSPSAAPFVARPVTGVP